MIDLTRIGLTFSKQFHGQTEPAIKIFDQLSIDSHVIALRSLFAVNARTGSEQSAGTLIARTER
ncbi:hypothetical protein [Microcystis aeruginosa]|uniref:hypothetical protein n=1 Tax=Microcystis aeruginosa TaxID=1126 RepID=UPI00132F71DF|nr:hypothetical protein [Microcystis aeruginosa]